MFSSLFQRPSPESGASPSVFLDVLRGVAILAVFVQHLGDRFMGAWERAVEGLFPRAVAPWVLTVLHHAYGGVDLFFVLSGLTLARGYASRYARGKELLAKDFLRRRAARILPAFAVALAVMLATHPRVLGDPQFPASLGLHALLLQGYAPEGIPIFIGAAWSLTTEAQFYLAMPLLAPLLLRPARPVLRALLWAAGLLAFAWLGRAALHALFVAPGVRDFAFELTQRRLVTSRIDQFVLGILVVRLGLDRLRLRRPWLAVGLSSAALVLAFRLEGTYYLEPLGALPYALVGLATTALVCSVLALPERAAEGRVGRAFAALGVVSYGVFLYHQLALGAVGALLPGEPSVGLSLVVGLAALAASFALGLLSFRYVERPFLAPRRASS
jgi:peptidoglycan/LPS O-acetylase OafA/YrhL